MPIGCFSCVPYVASELVAKQPKNVLDLGVGFGFYASVVRQWLDFGVQPWRTRLVGVDGWKGYRNPCWRLYDQVHVEPIEAYLDRNVERFDAILMMDVLEHFEKDVGFSIIAKCRETLSDNGILLIATPGIWMEQGAVYGNEFERHRSLWSVEDFKDFTTVTDGKIDQFGHQMVLVKGVSDGASAK